MRNSCSSRNARNAAKIVVPCAKFSICALLREGAKSGEGAIGIRILGMRRFWKHTTLAMTTAKSKTWNKSVKNACGFSAHSY